MRVMAIGQRGQLVGGVDGVFFEDRRVGREWMAGDVEAEQFLFMGQ